MKRSIKFKFLLGLLVIFLSSFMAINFFLSNIIERNIEKIINEDLLIFKENSNIYIRQSLMLNKYNNEEKYFKEISKDVAHELSNSSDSEICMYTNKGEYIYSSAKERFKDVNYNDIENAINDKESYIIKYDGNNRIVYFSYKVDIAGEKIGILRMSKDYSVLFERNENILKVIEYMTILIFAIAFFFAYLLARKITVPIIQLTNASNEIEKGNLNIKVNVNSNDEIGELAENFSRMVKKIDSQIKIIKKDRDNLIEVNNHRKKFFDNITHELKTPLTSIIGYSEMIQENGFTDKIFFDKGINNVILESQRLHDMVVRLLEYSKESSQLEEPFEKIDITKIVEESCVDMTFKANRYRDNICFEFKENIYIAGSRNKLKQVFINLIDNAIKYGELNSEIKVTTYIEDNFAIIKVENIGAGIEKEEIDKIFTPFSKIRSKKNKELGSCGLGLSISKEIIDKHNGEISIESIANKNTIVTVKLPLYCKIERTNI